MAAQPHPNHTAQSRAETNRQNAQHSTGPRTEAGRQRVRHNALKHGLTAQHVFLAEGESERYEGLLANLTTMWRPTAGIERDLVLSLRDAMWRLNSIPVTQINLTTLATEEHMEAYEHLSHDPAAQRCAAQAAAYRANAKLFDQLSRHEMRLERTIRKIEAELDRVQADRIAQAEEAEKASAEREYLQHITRQQEEQVAAYLAAKKAEAAKQSQPAPGNVSENGQSRPTQPRTESATATAAPTDGRRS